MQKKERLSETDLGSLLEGRLDQAKRTEAERHLLESNSGLAELMTARRVMDSGEPDLFPGIPDAALEKARRAYPAHQGIFDVVLGFARDALKVVQCGPEVSMLSPEPACGVRTVQAAASPGLITFTKKFREVDLEFDVEKTAGSFCVIKVVLRQPGVKDRFRGLRISLLSDGRELASSLAPGGETLFEDVHPGSYTIVVSRGGMRVAETALKFIA